MKKIGILTSGGDCQGLNAAIRGVAKALYKEFAGDIVIVGIEDGYGGLIHGNSRTMEEKDFSGILTRGGTILGTSRQPFKLMRIREEENGIDKVACMKENYERMELDCLVTIGGNGTHKTSNLLSMEGLNVIGLPKTIDNDIWGTDVTFGFQSAMDIATDVIDRIHSTATSHGRIFVIEIMGHKVGWLTLCAGIAGGADIILIPEIPYDINSIVAEIERREKMGKEFSIIAAAEGAKSVAEAKMKKKEFKEHRAKMKHSAISYRIAEEIKSSCGRDVRVTIPGHIQRGGSPCPYDRLLSTRLGTAAAKLIKEENFGNMVALKCGKIVPVPLSEIAGKLKSVPVDCEEVKCAREMGICLGD